MEGESELAKTMLTRSKTETEDKLRDLNANKINLEAKLVEAKSEKVQAETTSEQAKLSRDIQKLEAQINKIAVEEENLRANKLLIESKARGQQIKNYNEFNKQNELSTGSKTSTKKSTGDIFTDELAKTSAKHVEPLEVIINPGDPDPPGLEMFGNMPIPAEKITLQPTDVRRLIATHKKDGEDAAWAYLHSIGQSARDSVYFMHRLFGWSDERRNKYLESLEPKKSFFSGFGF